MEELFLIEKETFEEMLARVGLLADQVELLYQNSDRKLGEWLDGQDVCLLLKISPRTLQSYRDSGKIGFSQINHKIYYKSDDVEKLINKNIINLKKQKHGINNEKT